MAREGSPRIKPCPWCGEDALVELFEERWRVFCDFPACPVCPKTVGSKTMIGAVTNWNNRKYGE